MNGKPSRRRRSLVAVVAVVVVVLSGCAGASGNGEEVSLVQDGSEPSNTATSVQTTETAPGSDDTTPTAAGSGSDAGVDSQADSGADTGADTGTPTTETATAAETTTETPTTSTEAPSTTTAVTTTETPTEPTETTTASTEAPSTTEAPTTTTTGEPEEEVEVTVESDGLTSVTGHEMDTSGGDVVVTGNLTNPTDARVSDPYVRITLYDDEGEEIAVGGDQATESEPISPLLEPGEQASFQVTFSDVDPDEFASYTIRSSAVDPDEDPATTRADIAVTFDRQSWQDDPLTVYLEVTNQKEETVERLDVVITAYDSDGNVIAEHTERITDLAIGETVTFEHVFEVRDNETDRVEVHVPGEDYGFVN